MRRDAEPVEVGDLSRASSSSGTRAELAVPMPSWSKFRLGTTAIDLGHAG